MHAFAPSAGFRTVRRPVRGLFCGRRNAHTLCRAYDASALSGSFSGGVIRTRSRPCEGRVAAVAEPPSDDLDPLESVWRSVPKHLLSIGRSGVKESHCRGLQELLEAHGLVKCKTMKIDPTETSQKFAEATNAKVLQIKGNTILFAKGELDMASITEMATKTLQEKSQTVAAREKAREESKKAQGRTDAIQAYPHLDMCNWFMPFVLTALRFILKTEQEVQCELISASVMKCLNTLYGKEIFKPNDIDSKVQRLLTGLPEDAQLAVLKSITKRDMRKVRNRSAWLTTRIRAKMDELNAETE